MPARIELADHLAPDELEQRYRAAKRPVDVKLWQVISLYPTGWHTEDIAEAVGYDMPWVRNSLVATTRAAPRQWAMADRTIPARSASWTRRGLLLFETPSITKSHPVAGSGMGRRWLCG